MQFSKAFAVVTALLPLVAAGKHRWFYNMEELHIGDPVPTGTVYDFTACNGKCQENSCAGDETRFTGDVVGEKIDIPGTKCIQLHPGVENKLWACNSKLTTNRGEECGTFTAEYTDRLGCTVSAGEIAVLEPSERTTYCEVYDGYGRFKSVVTGQLHG